MMKIQNHIKAGRYAFNFTEVVVTKGINPEYAGAVVAEINFKAIIF